MSGQKSSRRKPRALAKRNTDTTTLGRRDGAQRTTFIVNPQICIIQPRLALRQSGMCLYQQLLLLQRPYLIQVLESTRRVDTIVLDKTGTVTTGRMSLVGVHPGAGQNSDELLEFAGALESASQHPIAEAIAASAAAGGTLPAVEDFSNHNGYGVSGVVAGHAVLVGRLSWLTDDWSLTAPDDLTSAAEHAQSQGHTPVWVAWDGAVRGVIVVADTVKGTSADAIGQFRKLGLRPFLLTGDNRRAALAVAAEVGIDPDDVIAEVLPADKVDTIKSLQAQGRTVAMVGDGVNDAAALVQADLGLAMGTGSDVAIEASDLTLVRGDLRAAADAIRLARSTLRTIKGNLFWAFAYNVAALPLAALGLLNPLIAGAAMAFSSVFVVSNSLRLRRFTSSASPGQTEDVHLATVPPGGDEYRSAHTAP